MSAIGCRLPERQMQKNSLTRAFSKSWINPDTSTRSTAELGANAKKPPCIFYARRLFKYIVCLLTQQLFDPRDDFRRLVHRIFDDFFQLFARRRIELELSFFQLG